MVLRMACPTKRKGSDNWYFRRKLPADLQRILASLPKSRRPPGWHRQHIVISLGTADRDAAKAKCPEVAATVERQMEALRKGPAPLTPKQIAGLSGLVYRAFTEGLEEDPVLAAEQWRAIAEANRDARLGQHGLGAQLGIFDDHADRREFSMESRFGKMVDAVLLCEGIVTDDTSRWRLIEVLSRDLTEAAEKLARNADGDYAPDAYATRFPTWEGPDAKPDAGRSISALVEAWQVGAIARGVRPRTAKRWQAAVLRFTKALGHDDLRRVTPAAVQRWANERNAAGISAKTINDTDLAALHAMFAWGKRAGWLDTNPAEEARIEGRGKPEVRERYFTSDEAGAILRAALAVNGTDREDPKTTAAKRWVPWLCAYSGARVMEMVQLRKQDVRRDGGTWVIRLTPEAGGIKTNKFRDVPVHLHLVEVGFIDFVKTAEAGHLFCHLGADGAVSGSAEGVYSRIREAVRGAVSDPAVQPSHAWRYTFKARGIEVGIEEVVLDAICGHAAATQGRTYSRVTLKTRVEAVAKVPRYRLHSG
ncbi:DUF6538 domain-containing protein [Rhodoplanes serenus]|uniref:DUF6538 domain-containing protein n=1 Tax=Rhodoplanes serenus TaxID=200615 RepID=UPI000DAED350|nr:DUF6538 domain-containing protein [Rhodoplanes serenus]RAI33881.1 hypothetical protein CH340_10815 [Rhodoplanes serenus]